jgi:hypothetical protein
MAAEKGSFEEARVIERMHVRVGIVSRRKANDDECTSSDVPMRKPDE